MTGKPQPIVNKPCGVCGQVLATEAGWRQHSKTQHNLTFTEKQCTKCRETKPLDGFPFGPYPGSYGSWCRSCKTKQATSYRKSRPESHVRRDRKKGIARYHGLTVEQYEVLWNNFSKYQGETCVCGGPLEMLDHDHKTGKHRGVLCRGCNLALGYVQDSPERLERLARYLRETGA